LKRCKIYIIAYFILLFFALKMLIDEELNAYLAAEDMESSAMKENDTRITNCRQKQNELFRIEQYADMALQYIRLGAETNNFVFENVMDRYTRHRISWQDR